MLGKAEDGRPVTFPAEEQEKNCAMLAPRGGASERFRNLGGSPRPIKVKSQNANFWLLWEARNNQSSEFLRFAKPEIVASMPMLWILVGDLGNSE